MWEVLRGDWLLALVRCVGVVVGILGAAIASPDAVRSVGGAISTFTLTNWWRLRTALGFSRALPVAGTAPATSGAAGTVNWTGSATGSVWSEDPDEQMRILRERTDNLARALETVRIANQAEVTGLRGEMERMRGEHLAEVEGIRAEQRVRERNDLRINARGLPIIGVAIILSGLPDPMVANPWLGWPLITVATIVTAAVLVASRGTLGRDSQQSVEVTAS